VLKLSSCFDKEGVSFKGFSENKVKLSPIAVRSASFSTEGTNLSLEVL
jgi:hypothetical protein